MRLIIGIFLLVLAGCATPAKHGEDAAEARGYERGYRQAVKEQYWIIQRQQRNPAASP
jgi:hypothetical protein